MKKLTDFDKELIQKELDKNFNGAEFKYVKPSNRWLDWLFNHYYLHEMCENFYDRELTYEEMGGEEKYNMYCDFAFNTHSCEESHTREEMKQAYFDVLKLFEDHEPARKSFCNWQEVYGEGIWGMSQKRCDEIAKERLKIIRKYGKIADRFFVRQTDKVIYIFFYGRDFYIDYWMIFAKNGVDLWKKGRKCSTE